MTKSVKSRGFFRSQLIITLQFVDYFVNIKTCCNGTIQTTYYLVQICSVIPNHLNLPDVSADVE